MAAIILLGLAGLILIMAEVFVPGGVLGFLGLTSIGFAAYLSFKEYGGLGLIITIVILVICSVTTWAMTLRLLPRTSMGRNIYLGTTQKGFDTGDDALTELAGKRGHVTSSLHPTGKIEIDDSRYDAVTDQGFIEKGSPIEVVGVRSNQLLVERVEEESEA